MTLAVVPPAPSLFGAEGERYEPEPDDAEPFESFVFVWRSGCIEADVFEEPQESPAELARVRRAGKVQWGWSIDYHLGDAFEQIATQEGDWSSSPQEAALKLEAALDRIAQSLDGLGCGR